MVLSEFLYPNEEIQISFDSEDMVEYAKTNYQVHFTTQRLILFRRKGLLFKRDSMVSIPFQEVIRLDYKEKGLRKKGYCVVATPLMKYAFKGKPEVIKELTKYLQKFIPTREIETVKEKETKIIEKQVLIPCKYCGGLMPQTSVLCPVCGAKSK